MKRIAAALILVALTAVAVIVYQRAAAPHPKGCTVCSSPVPVPMKLEEMP